jgi:tetratricopeptide (TPR) repeat protein
MSIGCIGSTVNQPPDAPPTTTARLPPAEQSKFDAALAAMAAHDRANDWTAAGCAEVAGLFLSVDSANAAAPLHNAGLARARCGDHEAARALFEQAARREPSFLGARFSLARYATGRAELDRAILDMQRAVEESRFQNVEALVTLGELLMRRGNGEADIAEAKRNFHRALAVDDRYMPALNQLALHYLAAAKRGGSNKAGAAALELTTLVCSQAIRKHPGYAPIHNTAGLAAAEQKNFSGAAEAFARARALDPAFFEAHMNYAAVNMAFRGFAEAEQAYRAALRVRPRDYDARLGLALALRGQIDDRNEGAQVEAARRELSEARAIAPDRPESYYNEAVLVQEFGAKAEDPAKRKQALQGAISLFKTFLAKAGGLPDLADAKRRATERIDEIDQIIGFLDPSASAPGTSP